jgi:hypothetical protein
MNNIWTEEERQFIRNNSNIITDEVGAKQLSKITGRHISVQSWRKQRKRMGIYKKPGRGICAVVRCINKRETS